jgi:hypothetical protein
VGCLGHAEDPGGGSLHPLKSTPAHTLCVEL